MSESLPLKGKCQLCPKESTARCSWCRLVFYCSKEHQKQDWKAHKDNCTKPKYKICEDEHLGRHLVTTESLKPDTILLKDKPLVFGPKIGVSAEVDDANVIYCLGCYKEIEEVKGVKEPECGLCGLPICSPACSDQHFHRDFECRFFREGKAGVLEGLISPNALAEPNSHLRNTVAVLQSLLYFRCLLVKVYFSEKWPDLISLQSNNEFREDMASLEKTARIFDDFKKVFSAFGAAEQLSKPDLHKIIGIISTNGFEFKIGTNLELIGIFPQFSLLEHSCCPNTKVYLVPRPNKDVGFELYVRSSNRISSGAHLSTTYTNLLWNTEKRREELKRCRYFWCDCPRCLDATELGTNFSTILCPVVDCKAFAFPVPKPSSSGASNTEMYWQCSSPLCGKTCESWQVKKVDTKLAEMVAKMKPTVKNYKEVLQKIEELVHPDYYLNFVVNHSLIQLFGQDARTRNSKEVLDEKIKLCNKLLATIKLLDPGLAKLHVYTAVVYYEMQAAILAMAGGEGEDDFQILRQNGESVKLAKVYLQKCINCFEYEFFDLPENKLKVLATKKMEYLNMILSNPIPIKH